MQINVVRKKSPTRQKFSHLCEANTNLKALSNTYDEGEIIRFDIDLANFCVESCAIGGLTGFKKEFTPGSHNEIDERSSNTATDKTLIIGEGIAACKVKDDDR